MNIRRHFAQKNVGLLHFMLIINITVPFSNFLPQEQKQQICGERKQVTCFYHYFC